jgi:hypothetical protein
MTIDSVTAAFCLATGRVEVDPPFCGAPSPAASGACSASPDGHALRARRFRQYSSTRGPSPRSQAAPDSDVARSCRACSRPARKRLRSGRPGAPRRRCRGETHDLADAGDVAKFVGQLLINVQSPARAVQSCGPTHFPWVSRPGPPYANATPHSLLKKPGTRTL